MLQYFVRLLDNLILKLFYVCLKITHRVDIEKVIKQAESYSVDIAGKTVGVHLNKEIIIYLLSIVNSFYSKTNIEWWRLRWPSKWLDNGTSERRDHPRLAKFVEKINCRPFWHQCAGKWFFLPQSKSILLTSSVLDKGPEGIENTRKIFWKHKAEKNMKLSIEELKNIFERHQPVPNG